MNDKADLLRRVHQALRVGLPLDVLGASTLDLYAFTHVVLYASDMGRRGASWPRPPEQIADEVDAALAAALDADNFDLAAELLWTWPMLGLSWSPTAVFAFEVLMAAQDEHGFLPGPQFNATPRRDEDWMLRTSYHATFVMGMLCAATLHRGPVPQRQATGPVAPSPPPRELLGLAPPTPRSPRWLGLQAGLDAARRDLLAPFMLNVAFRRSAAAHDMPRLRDRLEAALVADLADGPAVQQALSLLRRVTSLAGYRQGL